MTKNKVKKQEVGAGGSFPKPNVPMNNRPFANLVKKPVFNGPRFNTAFKTQNRGGK
jgi:hypothetical protein